MAAILSTGRWAKITGHSNGRHSSTFFFIWLDEVFIYDSQRHNSEQTNHLKLTLGGFFLISLKCKNIITNICVSKLTIFGSDNGLSSARWWSSRLGISVLMDYKLDWKYLFGKGDWKVAWIIATIFKVTSIISHV